MPPLPSIFAFHTRFQWASLSALGMAALALALLVWQSSLTASRARSVQALLVQIEQVQGDLIDLETGVRGYVITGDRHFLEPYTAAQGRIVGDVQALEAGRLRVISGPRQTQGEEMAPLIVRWLTLGEAMVRARQQSAQQAASLVASGRSKALMDRLRARLAHDREQANAELLRRTDAERAVTLSGLVLLALLLVATLALMVSGRRLNLAMRGVLVDATRSAEALGSGDYTARMPHSASHEGELLASAFNHMAGRLDQTLRELRTSNARLEHSNRELEQFAFVASHDLKTPLRTLTSFSELLARRLGPGLDSRNQRDLNYIAQAARRMNEQIDDLLNYARIQRADLTLAPLPLSQPAQAAVRQLRERMQAAGGHIGLGQLPQVLGDRVLLEQVFVQLFDNALRHHPGGPQVQVQASVADSWCTVRVMDDGPGVPEAYRERAFQLFQRVHAGGGPESSGVGLTLCRQIVERHGGRIWLEDRPGGTGLVVAFTLPVG